MVEEILAKFLGQQSDGEGTFSATLLSDKHRYGFISVQHVHLQPMGYCRTEPDGAPAKLFAGQPRNSAEKSSHMVLAIPFRQLVHVFLDRVEDGNGIRLDVLLDVLSWRLLLADSQFLGAANDGVESLSCKHLPVLLLRVDAEELGLSVQNISAEEVKLLQKALYLVDC